MEIRSQISVLSVGPGEDGWVEQAGDLVKKGRPVRWPLSAWMAGLSAERNADGHRLQCLARALVRVALFVIALRKRLALVDGDAARDHPPLIGNGLRDPIADETLAGLVFSGHAIAASSGLGLVMLVAIPVGLAGLLPYERLRRRVLGNRSAR